MNDQHYKLLAEITTKYKLNRCNALEELLILEEHQHIKHLPDKNVSFGNTFFYTALGYMSKRYKDE